MKMSRSKPQVTGLLRVFVYEACAIQPEVQCFRSIQSEHLRVARSKAAGRGRLSDIRTLHYLLVHLPKIAIVLPTFLQSLRVFFAYCIVFRKLANRCN